MEYVVIAFRARSETVAFSNYLNKNGISNQIVNTPKEAGVGCGLSVKINKEFFSIVKRGVFSFNPKSFAGFFSVKTLNGKNIVHTI